MNRKKKAVILNQELEYIYTESKYKKDFAFFLIQGILSGEKKDSYILFNGMIRINKTYQVLIKGQKRLIICHAIRIKQVLEWLNLRVYLFLGQKKTETYIHISNPINFEYKSKKQVNYY